MKFEFDPLHFIRLLQGVFALITLSLYASVASYYSGLPSPLNLTPGQFAYPIFISTLTLLVTLPYLILTPRFFPALAHRYAMLGIEAVTCILWFAAWVASAAYLGSLSVCRGGICTSAKAGTVFAAFEWILFSVTAVFAGMYVFGNKRDARGGKAGGLGGNVSLRGLAISRPVGLVSSNEAVKMHDSWPTAGQQQMV